MRERDVENAALAALQSGGYELRYGPELGPDAPAAERHSFDAVYLVDRLKSAVARINPNLRPESVESAMRQVARSSGTPSLTDGNRQFHRMLTDGVRVEYRDKRTGELRGGQAKLIDFDNAISNHFLAVHQLTFGT